MNFEEYREKGKIRQTLLYELNYIELMIILN